MQSFNLGDLISQSATRQQRWLEFLRTQSLSMGLYRLQTGQADEQRPHTEDEVYYVISGRGWFRSGQEERPVEPGTLIFVERLVEHRFYDIAEELTVLVFFAPAEGSLVRPGPS